MEILKRTLILFLIVGFMVPLALISDKDIRLELPVRVFDGKEAVAGLQPASFKLFVNNQPREILEVLPRTASMSETPDFLRRYFILSFHTTDYGREMREAVSYFIGDVLTPRDSLVLVSPLKIYNINVTGNKERVISDIEKLVKEDCSAYKKKLEAAKKDLENELKQMNKLFSGALDRDREGITVYKMISMFLSTFPRNYLNFRNYFLFPHTDKYRQMMALLQNREGQRWWVHVQESQTYGFISQIQEVNRKIERYSNNNPLLRQSFSTHLNQFEKQLQLTGSFPHRQLIDILTAGDTRFNAILVGNQKSSTGGASGVIYQLEGILNHIARDTGGKTVHTVNPERGMQELVDHKDHFYRLIYRFDGKLEDKTTHITGNGKTFKFLYNPGTQKDRLQNLVYYLGGKRVTISGVSLEKNMLRFSIGSITLHKTESFGLVKVRIQLLDNAGAGVYRSENTLRSSKREVAISLPLPRNFKRASKLVIHACDLVANQLESFTKRLY